MGDAPTSERGAWFRNREPGDVDAAARAITDGQREMPDDWPQIAVDTGFASSKRAYYDALRAATIHAARQEVQARERADDQQVKHAVRALDDLSRVANELDERHSEWATRREPTDERHTDDRASDQSPDQFGPRLERLGALIAELQDERAALETAIEQAMPGIAPNLTALAGPLLGARLIALAGSLEALAKMPSGTVQLLGAEDALFAHLRGQAPSPKHGVIYTHEYVRGTAPTDRGTAARAVAGKLTIAARIDHYAGDLRPNLGAELDERMRRIRGRTND